jgi:hypothetical protein
MSISSPRAESRPHRQGLRVATVSVLIGAAAIAGLLLGSSFTSDGPAVAGESGASGPVLVLLLVAVGLTFVAGVIVGLRLQRRARAGARVEPVAEVDPVAEAKPAREVEPASAAELARKGESAAKGESARMPGPGPARSQGKRRVSAAPENNGTQGSTAPPARG